MDDDDLSFFRSWFHDHAASHYSKDEHIQKNIELKEQHTYRVCKNIGMIGRDMGLTREQLLIGETIALFHDIGRFEQFKRYGTFDDRRSERHAELSLKVLEQGNVLDRLSEKEATIVKRAISYHSLRELPGDETDVHLLYSRLLRDADKLDIWFVMTEYFQEKEPHSNPALELELPDEPVYDPYFTDRIMEHKCADGKKVRTLNDMKLFMLGWVFDVNFLPTYRYIRDLGYVDKFIVSLPDTEDIRKVEGRIDRYIGEKIKGGLVTDP